MIAKLPKKRIGNILLRELLKSDYVDLFRIGQSPIMCKYLNWGPYKYIGEALFTIENYYLSRLNDNLPSGYAIVIDDALRGILEFHSYDKVSNSIEIGYFLEDSYTGRGIMTKCLKEAIKVAFYDLEVDRIIISTLVDNLNNIKLIEKMKFRYDKEEMIEVDENVYKLGRYYSLDRFDYNEED